MNENEYDRLMRDPIGKEFRNVVKGYNFITPVLLEYGRAGKYIYELSKSTDSCGSFFGKIYGVTVVYNKENRFDLSKGGFESIESARDYIKQLEDL